MAQFTITINDAEEKALLTNMISVQTWLNNAIHEKARRVIDDIVRKNTDRQPKKMAVIDKHQMIMDMKLESGAERNARIIAEQEKEYAERR